MFSFLGIDNDIHDTHENHNQTWWLTLSGCSKTMLNILEKFCPKWCDVAACRKCSHLKPYVIVCPAYSTTPTYLYAPPTGGDKGLDGGRIVSSGKLLLLCLPPRDDWNRQQLLVHCLIQSQYLHHLQWNNDSYVYRLPWIRHLTSASASGLLAKVLCPSCHRNSRVLRNGWGCLNSHLCQDRVHHHTHIPLLLPILILLLPLNSFHIPFPILRLVTPHPHYPKLHYPIPIPPFQNLPRRYTTGSSWWGGPYEIGPT